MFEGGKSPLATCTCDNGYGGPDAPSKGCDMGLRGSFDGKGDGQSCLWWSQACSIGCAKCGTETAGTTPLAGKAPRPEKLGFRTSYCNDSTVTPTLPRHAWTLNMDVVEGSEEDSYRYNPWRAPGAAPVVDPCGQAAGEFGYQKLGGESVFLNTSIASMGMLGSKLPPTPKADRPKWVIGSAVEVAWGVRYNHGGGYAYRLCPAGEPLTEACFQKHHLAFDTSKQVLKWNNGSMTYEMKDKAIFVDGNVTFPKGSMWARNPLPRIWDSKVGLHDPDACPGPSTRAAGSPPGCMAFPPPCPWDTYTKNGLKPCTKPTDADAHPLHKCDGDGMGECSSDWVTGVISDRVLVPRDLPPGAYVLSWRWDAEETAQVWNNCADVTLVSGAPAPIVVDPPEFV
jgi:hypothetical protein